LTADLPGPRFLAGLSYESSSLFSTICIF